MLGLKLVDNIHKLSVSEKVIYLVMIKVSITNIRASFLTITNAAWAAFYRVTATVTTVYLIYAVLRLTGTLGPKDYIQAIRWVAVLLFSTLGWPGMLHIWEQKALKSRLALHKEEDNDQE